MLAKTEKLVVEVVFAGFFLERLLVFLKEFLDAFPGVGLGESLADIVRSANDIEHPESSLVAVLEGLLVRIHLGKFLHHEELDLHQTGLGIIGDEYLDSAAVLALLLAEIRGILYSGH